MTRPNACLLPHRGVIRVAGDDRRAFLQGLISNDIELCTPTQAIYAALLTPQGKFLHDLFIVDRGDGFLIDCELARAEDLLTLLRKHKLRAKVTLENLAYEYDVWVSWPAAEPPEKIIYYNDPRLPELGGRMMIKKGAEPKNTQPADPTAYDKHRLTLGVPDGSRDMLIEKSTLLECNIDMLNGISWSKGCYMGQELTARMHYRALVKKRLFPVRISGPAPAFGTIITLNGEDIGDMRSSCNDIGLALLNIERAKQMMKKSSALTSNNCKLNPYQPSWLSS